MRDMAAFNGRIEAMAVKGGLVKVTLVAASTADLIGQLVDLSEARDGLAVVLQARQLRMDTHDGRDGFAYPTADRAGRPLARDGDETLPVPGTEGGAQETGAGGQGEGQAGGDRAIPLDQERDRRRGRGGQPF